MFVLNRRLAVYGFGLWAVGTVLLRLAGQHVLHPGSWGGTLVLFGITLPVVAWLARHLCEGYGLPRQRWPVGAISLVLPTLVLDPFSSAFFAVVFPNIPAGAAGIFGGWMLICCAGAMIGVTMRR